MSQSEITNETKPMVPLTTTQTNGTSTSPRTTLMKEEHDSNDIYNEKMHPNEDIPLNIRNICGGDIRLYHQLCDKILFELKSLAHLSITKEVGNNGPSVSSDDKDEGSDSNMIKKEDNSDEEENVCSNNNVIELDDVNNPPDNGGHSAYEDKDSIKSFSLDQIRAMYIQYIVQAAQNAHDSTVESIINSNRNISSKEEQQLSLLLFETYMSKHEKMSLAFEILANGRSTNQYQSDITDDSPNASKRQKLSHEFFSDSPTTMETEPKRLNISINEVEMKTLLKCILTSLTSIVKQSNITVMNDVPLKANELIESLMAFKRNNSNGSNEHISLGLFREWYENDHDIYPIIDLLEYKTWKSCEEHSEQTKLIGKNEPSQEHVQARIDLSPKMKHEQVKEEDDDMLVVLSPISSFPPIVNNVTDETNSNNINSGNKSSPLEISPQSPPKAQPTTSQAMKSAGPISSPSSRAVVSFDITSNGSSQNPNIPPNSPPFNILITEENLQQLEKLVEYSNLIHKPPTFLTEKLFQYSTKENDKFKLEAIYYSSFIDDVFSSSAGNSHHYKDFFRILLECFDYHNMGFVNCIEVGIGFSFLCAGNKSSKLAMAYELLDTYKVGYLNSKSLHVYFRSFLNMLVGISLLTHQIQEGKVLSNKKIVYQALNYGATWTQEHLLSSMKKQQESEIRIKFEDFAEWYTEGGYTVAPWLELLDLGKFLSLLHSSSGSSSKKEDDCDRRQQHHGPSDRYSPGKHEPTKRHGNGDSFHTSSMHSSKGSSVKPSNYYPYPQQQHPLPHQPPNQHPSSFFPPSPTNSAHSSIQSRGYNPYPQHQPHSYPPLPPAPLPPGNHGRPHPNNPPQPDNEVLFTFPLANDQSLIVQKEDALYVKTVVTQLGLLVLEPEEVWNILYHNIPSVSAPSSHSHHFKCMKIDQRQFVHAMEMVLVRCYQLNPSLKSSSKRIDPDSIFTLTNFYQSYDLEQMNSVPLNQLMGGLTLLCGGRKSIKLNFAFCLFSSSTTTAEKILNGDELYYFLRSYLIILFSCCAQSLHLTADCVSKYIQDTSYKVCDDVMRHQWYHKRIRFVTFDDFGDWYNEGGYDVAPWLELLDLKKWVFMDEDQPQPPGVSLSSSGSSSSRDHHHHHQSSYYPPARNGIPLVDGKPHHVHHPPSISQSHSMTMEEDIMDYNPAIPSNSNYAYRNNRYSSHPPPVGTTSTYDNNMMDDNHDYYNYNPPPHHQQHPEEDRNHSHLDSRRPNRYNTSGTTPPPPHHHSSYHQHQQPQSESSKPSSSSQLSFQLHTNDDYLGYHIAISQQRVSFLKRIILESGLSNLDVNFVCNRILEYAQNKENDTTNPSSKKLLFLPKDRFDMVMKNLLSMGKKDGNLSLDDQRSLADLFTSIFNAFDRNKSKVVDALELTCGLSILCGGRKSDKLEYAFDLLSEQEHTMTNTSMTGNHNCLTRRNMFRYLRSFLTVLMSITLSAKSSNNILESCRDTISTLNPTKKKVSLDQIIDTGSAWATDQVFINSNTSKVSSSSRQKGGNTIINFDDFADWYTRGGYSHIPWLELLDLRKWMFT